MKESFKRILEFVKKYDSVAFFGLALTFLLLNDSTMATIHLCLGLVTLPWEKLIK
jgi:hypothetical protein